MIWFVAELILGLLPTLLKLVCGVDNDDSGDGVLFFGQKLSQLTRALIFMFLFLRNETTVTCEIDLCDWSASGTPSPSLILSVLAHLGETSAIATIIS